MTVQQLINLARRHFQLFDEQEALTYLQGVHNKILRLVRIKPDETVDVSLTADTYNYTLATTIVRIWDARYVLSSTTGDSRPLYSRSVDQLDWETKGIWRTQPSATPIWYDERSGELILYPTPDTTTSAGYPKVTLTVQKTDVLTMASTLPTQVDEYDAWIYGLCRKYAAEKERDQYAFFDMAYRRALNDLISFSEGKAARDMPNIQADIPRPMVS